MRQTPAGARPPATLARLMQRRGFLLSGGLFGVAVALLWVLRPPPPPRAIFVPPSPVQPLPPPVASVDRGADSPVDDGRVHAFRLPAGDAPGLTCEQARAVVQQARTQLAYVPEPVDPKALADAAADWLDPYGLWSVAPDSPVVDAFAAHAPRAAGRPRGSLGRTTAPGRALSASSLVAWIDELRRIFDGARATKSGAEDRALCASGPAFEGATVTRPARTLAATLGRRAGVLDRELGSAIAPYVDAARARYFPTLDPDAWAPRGARGGGARLRARHRSRTAPGLRSTRSRASTRSTSRPIRRLGCGTRRSARRSA